MPTFAGKHVFLADEKVAVEVGNGKNRKTLEAFNQLLLGQTTFKPASPVAPDLDNAATGALAPASRWHGKDYYWVLEDSGHGASSALTKRQEHLNYRDITEDTPVAAAVAALQTKYGWTDGLCCSPAELAAAGGAREVKPVHPANSAEWVAVTSTQNLGFCKFLQPKAALLFNPPDMEGQLQPCLHSDVWRASSLSSHAVGGKREPAPSPATDAVYSIIVSDYGCMSYCPGVTA